MCHALYDDANELKARIIKLEAAVAALTAIKSRKRSSKPKGKV
jgi:hypothetical protein